MLWNCGVGEDSSESFGLQGDQISQSKMKPILNIQWKNWRWSWSSNTWPPNVKHWLIWKDPDAGKDWRQEEKGLTEDEMVGWHHWLYGYEFKQAPGVGDGPGSLACCYPLEATELNWSPLILRLSSIQLIWLLTLIFLLFLIYWETCSGSNGALVSWSLQAFFLSTSVVLCPLFHHISFSSCTLWIMFREALMLFFFLIHLFLFIFGCTRSWLLCMGFL